MCPVKFNGNCRSICPTGKWDENPTLLNCTIRNLVFSSYTDILKFVVSPSQQKLSKKKLQNVEIEREEIGQGARLFVSILGALLLNCTQLWPLS